MNIIYNANEVLSPLNNTTTKDVINNIIFKRFFFVKKIKLWKYVNKNNNTGKNLAV